MKIDKETRLRVWRKFDCKCSYCGNDLDYKKMQVDHFIPLRRNDTEKQLDWYKVKRGTNDFENLFPSCARCNRWKSDMKIERFRKEIELQFERLIRDSNQFRMAFDFGIIKQGEKKVKFWYEICRLS